MNKNKMKVYVDTAWVATTLQVMVVLGAQPEYNRQKGIARVRFHGKIHWEARRVGQTDRWELVLNQPLLQWIRL